MLDLISVLSTREPQSPHDCLADHVDPLVAAVFATDLAAVRDLLLGPNPIHLLNSALGVACINGCWQILDLLLAHGADPVADDQQPLVLAAGRGHLRIVQRLLQVPGVDPALIDWLPLQRAVCRGQRAVANCLLGTLSDHDRRRLVRHLNLLRLASSSGHIDLVSDLLSLVDDPMEIGASLREAAESGHIAVVNQLIVDGRCDQDANSEALAAAAQSGHCNIVKFLMANTSADPSWNLQYSLRWAAALGFTAIIDLLLIPSVDPSMDDNITLKWAVMQGRLAAAERLLHEGRVLEQIRARGGVISFADQLPERTRKRFLELWRRLREERRQALLVASVLEQARVPCYEMIAMMAYGSAFRQCGNASPLAAIARSVYRIRMARPQS